MTGVGTTTAPVAPDGWRARPTTWALWGARVVLALVFLGAGAAKLGGDPAMVTMFEDVGAGQWLRYLVGGVELAGAVGVLVPRLAVHAAAGLALLMVGATATNVVVLASSPVLTLVLGAVAAGVAVVLRRRVGAVSG